MTVGGGRQEVFWLNGFVAQTGSLLYRGLAIRSVCDDARPADCQSAKRQVANLRYTEVGKFLSERLRNGVHHAVDADAGHAAEINRAFAQETR